MGIPPSTADQLFNLNRARSYLADLVKDCPDTEVFDSIEAAVEHLVEKHGS
jgi:hypothetical protein